MSTKGAQTREQILATAESIMLKRGYAGTSIEDIITRTGITKGGFFYHFEGKNDLAKHLMLRYLEEDEKFFLSLNERARSLTEDPLQQLLIFLKLMAEAMADLPGTHPGCLVASFVYESQQFNDEVNRLNAEGVRSWRRIFMEHLETIVEKYPLVVETSLEDLADMLTGVIEGGIILSKVFEDARLLPSQLMLYRDYIRLLFGAV